MSQQDLLAPGKVLPKALINPGNGQVVLRAGTELTKAHLEQVKKEGLESALRTCLASDAPPGDLGDFEIDIPELPSFLGELMASVPEPPPPPPASEPAPPAPPAAAPRFSPETGYGMPPAPPEPLRAAAPVSPPVQQPVAAAPAAAPPPAAPAYSPPPPPPQASYAPPPAAYPREGAPYPPPPPAYAPAPPQAPYAPPQASYQPPPPVYAREGAPYAPAPPPGYGREGAPYPREGAPYPPPPGAYPREGAPYPPPPPAYAPPYAPPQAAYPPAPPAYGPPPGAYPREGAPYPPPPPAYGPPGYDPARGYGAGGYAPPERTAYQAPAGYAPPPAYAPRSRYDGGLPPRLISPYSDKLGPQTPPPGAPGSGVTTNRYYHNPAHLLTERTVRQLMLCAEILEEHVRQGRTPPYEPIREVVDEVIDRLGSNIQQLNHGIEIRITGQTPQRSHAPNVMLLSLVMGLALNYNQRELVTLALGALCHDIGKTAIAPDLLNKVGPLSPAEIELLRTHPTMGKRIMSRLPWSSPLIATIVHQHHERNDGSGYPQRLLDTQIYDLAKIVALAEVYDGLLQVQPYRPAVVPEAAYKLVCNWEKTRLDPEVAHAFQRFVVPYPLYAYVLLDTQEVAQVVYVNPQDVVRPVVKLRGELLDLAWTPDRKIVGLHIQPFDPA